MGSRDSWSRIRQVCDLIPSGARVVDARCGNALLAIEMAQRKHDARIIGVDVSQPLLRQAEDNIRRYNLKNMDSLRFGEGLSPLTAGEADTAVFSGLGEHLIFAMLTDQQTRPYITLSPQSIRYEILLYLDNLRIGRVITQPSPLRGVPFHYLRTFMLSHGWNYEAETIIKTGRAAYIATSFVRGEEDCTKYHPISAKEVLHRSPLTVRYLQNASSVEERQLYKEYLQRNIATLTHMLLQQSLHAPQITSTSEREILDALESVEISPNQQQ